MSWVLKDCGSTGEPIRCISWGGRRVRGHPSQEGRREGESAWNLCELVRLEWRQVVFMAWCAI